jgi:nitrate reductase cytochrome c-type subunit
MPINRSTALCLRCHQRLTARPKEFPQIDSPAHVTDKGAEFAADICLECHDAHNPSE